MHFAGNILYWFLIQLKHHIFFAQNSAPKLRILYPITHVIEKDCWAYIPLCTTKKLAHSTIFYKKPDLCQTLTYVHDVISNIYAWLLLPNWYGSQKAKNSSNTDFLIFFSGSYGITCNSVPRLGEHFQCNHKQLSKSWWSQCLTGE